MFRRQDLELGTSSAPLQLDPELLQSYKFVKKLRYELDWAGKNGQLRSSGAFSNFFKCRCCRIHLHWFPYSVWFPLFSQWIRYWASVIFLTVFLLATLFPAARALSASANKVGICFHSVQSSFDLSRVQCPFKYLCSLKFRQIRIIVSYLIIFFS